MKKLLLATTAIVSAGMLAGAGEVAAQDKPISLVLGGYFRSALAVNSDDDNAGQRGASRRNHRVAQDVEVHFKGETTLANGITVGVVVELEAQEQNGDQVDETWAYMKGKWGELRYGDEDSVHRLAALTAPLPLGDGMFGSNSPFFTFSNNAVRAPGVTTGPVGAGTNTTSLDLSTDSSKILYFTPRMSGFQAGVSYAPDATQDCRTGNGTSNGCGAGTGAGRLKNDGLAQVFAAQVNYNGKVGALDLLAMVGYSRATNEVPGLNSTGTTNVDPDTWLAGLTVGYMGWSVGGSYQKINDGAGNAGENGIQGRRASTFDVGLGYSPGPWGLAVNFSRGEYTVSSTTSGAAATSTVKDTLSMVSLAGAYLLGPGIRLNAGVEYLSYDPGSVGTTASFSTYDSKAFLIGSTIIF
ncbi:MAG: porin [Alphaproteobacteria bacterium]|nr:porin [Alphaproteobacteria bacterium]